MAKRTIVKPRPLAEIRDAVGRMQVEGERLAGRIRKEARTLVAKGRAELTRDVGKLRGEVGRGATRAVRRLETRVLKDLHLATREVVVRLEHRVRDLEKRVEDLARRAAGEHAA
jgi:hypothetical protein